MVIDVCRHIRDECSFIWCVLYCYLVKEDLAESIQQVSSMYERGITLSTEYEELLLRFWETGAEAEIFLLGRKVLEMFVLDIGKHVALVSLLVDAGHLSINEASGLLQLSRETNDEGLSDSVRHALDVAWLTNEDRKDGILTPDEDDLLFNALKDVKESLLAVN